ncbi:hypothetical protein B0I35DRAFT_432097 [Stachybotrys elegans]|uniref:Secreted protein n=1 Tax=Stachybotrys elegans TaxID=80388 RepID=A0A8K0WSF3_9HYPO|nr:hypothetical protein B0I35DRAFT_432097 [Stachybotrys elegans]
MFHLLLPAAALLSVAAHVCCSAVTTHHVQILRGRGGGMRHSVGAIIIHQRHVTITSHLVTSISILGESRDETNQSCIG